MVAGRSPLLSGFETDSPTTNLLWYRSPAKKWTEALILGNGRLGAMVWGGPKSERIQLNEDTLWSGEPRDTQNYTARQHLPEVKRLLLEGKE